MAFLSVADTAKRWNLSERSVRNYCANGRIEGAFLTGKTWNIPDNAVKPERSNKSRPALNDLVSRLRQEKQMKLSGGIYHRIQIELTYNSNHMEGSQLTHDQTRMIFETNTIGTEQTLRVDDVIETVNHFKCVDLIIDDAEKKLSERMIKQLHRTLKSGTSDSRLDWFAVGDYKKLPNEVGGRETSLPENTERDIRLLLKEYHSIDKVSFDDLLDFHVRFELIHPFQDGNGRVGRLILFKECLHHGFVPFIITDELKWYYYRGLQHWKDSPGYLRDTCLTAQDQFKLILDYFKFKYH